MRARSLRTRRAEIFAEIFAEMFAEIFVAEGAAQICDLLLLCRPGARGG